MERVHQPPTEDEIGPVADIIFDSPEQKAKEVFHRSSPKAHLEPNDEVVEFTPDYVQTGIVLNASGFDPSKSDFVGFKLLEHRRHEQPVDYNTLPQQILTAQSDWQMLLQEAETRSMRQSTQQLANLPQNKPATATLSKRESYETRSQMITPSPNKKRKSGKSGAKQCSKVGCDNVEGEGIQFNRVPAEPPVLPDGASIERKLTTIEQVWLESMERVGRMRGSDKTKGLRICNCHATETIRRRLYVDDNGTKTSKLFDLTVVVGQVVHSSSSRARVLLNA
jgi:hypothetical protein